MEKCLEGGGEREIQINIGNIKSDSRKFTFEESYQHSNSVILLNDSSVISRWV